MSGPTRLLTAEDLAEAWQVPVSQIYRLTRNNQLPAVRVGRYYRYRLTDIETFDGTNNQRNDT